MGIKNKFKKEGFTIFEALAAIVIFAIIASGLAGLFILQAALIPQMSHRIEAINYARSAAEQLLEMGSKFSDTFPPMIPELPSYWFPEELSRGTHTEATDPHVCGLPDGYFKNHLNGTLSYVAENIYIDENTYARRIIITVEWDEESPKVIHKSESLVIVPFFGEDVWIGAYG